MIDRSRDVPDTVIQGHQIGSGWEPYFDHKTMPMHAAEVVPMGALNVDCNGNLDHGMPQNLWAWIASRHFGCMRQ